MHKNHIVKAVQKELQISEQEYKEALEVMLAKIVDILIKEKKVNLRNFGTFTIKIHKARKGINPKTGASLNIPQKRVIKFNSCKVLKEKINGTKK